ncbi:carbohydrate sulfotransferase 11 isoform X2 [Cephus cinctus]|uniref:Carbohydrate sulfotransferase n=1 Tax=Cephus cinctus TaxID=211228 RepID=A0AAJ7FL28_CEPCN|nr:carbohydrate sulfotransferase 11 isoform X2 [Cephus cinctus]
MSREEVRYEYRKKCAHRQKMTPRCHLLAGVRRTVLVAGVLALVILALSNQEDTNDVHQVIVPEEYLSPEEKLMEQNVMADTEVRLAERRKFLAEKCSQEGLDRPGNDSLHRPNAWEFLVNREHHIIWCNIFKAASTSWMYNFNLLAGYSPQFLKTSKTVPMTLARQRYPRPTAEELARYLNDSISFLIVRHPFERLLSAYRDKLKQSLPHTYHSKIGASIVSHYRPRDPKTGMIQGPKYPLFEEFVAWLLCDWKAGKELDMHWTPVANFCTPCQVRFDVIAKFETLHDDQNFLIKQARVGHIVKPEWKNSARGVQTKDVIKTYYARLTNKNIEELYEMFKYDFILFDYYPDEYFNIGKEHNNLASCRFS